MKLITDTTKHLLFSIAAISLLISSNIHAADQRFKNIQQQGILNVGMSGEQPPFNFVAHTQAIVGYDVELANALANAMNKELRIQLLPFSQLQSSLLSGEIDLIISGMSVTQARSEDVHFIGPYTSIGKSILTTKSKLKSIKETTGFNHKSVRLTAIKDSTSLTLVKERLGRAQLQPITHYEEGYLAIFADKADALVADMSICQIALIRDTTGSLAIIEKPLAIEEVGIAISQDEPQLEAIVAAHLQEMIASKQLDALHKRWFQSSHWLTLLP